MTTRQRNRKPRGQVLIFAVMILLILLVVCFFLFDLQSVIRTRGKAQNGADAAALTAAAWQGRSLNLIGELNLMKASTVMVYGIPPEAPPGQPAETVPLFDLQASIDLLTQMQLRTTYVGPLLGFAAAQQSARHNGIRNVPLYTNSVAIHLNQWISMERGGTYALTYGADPRGLGYDWLRGYEEMMEEVISRGIAARPVNSRYLHGGPRLNGWGGSLLLDPDFYRAVYARNYCWFYNRGLGPDAPPIDLATITYATTPEGWFPGSEFLPLYVELAAAPDGVLDLLAPHVIAREMIPLPDTDPDTPGRQFTLPEMEWAVFDSVGDGWGWQSTEIYDYVNDYLRSPFRQEYTYGGPAARFITTAQPAIISGRWDWQHGERGGDDVSIGRSIELPGSGRMAAAESNLDTLRSSEVVESVGAAKPFGEVDGEAPYVAGLILPVYTDVRLIPVSLVNSTLIDRYPHFYQFIIDVFAHPDYPDIPDEIRDRYSNYLNAIAMFNDMDGDFRLGWWDYDAVRDEIIEETGDDPCFIPSGPGGPGGGSRGGPGIIH